MTKAHRRTSRWFAGIALASLILPACAKPTGIQAKKIAQKITAQVGCDGFEDEFWLALYDSPASETRLPTEGEFHEAMLKALDGEKFATLTPADRTRLRESFERLYTLLAQETPRALQIDPSDDARMLEAFTSIAMGDRTSPEKERLQTLVRNELDRIESLASTFSGNTCPPPAPAQVETMATTGTAPTLFQLWKTTKHPVVYGALKVISTAYQSCDAGLIAPMNKTVPPIQGVSVVGTHPDGVGFKRVVSDLPLLVKTHYYIANQKPNSNTCFDVKASPLIYDYGGKPYATSSLDSRLDFFKNAGSGTSVLGIDCSGFVYSALASSGLKLKKKGRLKAIESHGVNARMYLNPAKNGLTCIAPTTFQGRQSIAAGDIVATNGHIVIVASTGADPFGVTRIPDLQSCTIDKIDVTKFDFTVLQSAPVFGGIGIDHVQARDYLSEPGPMRTGFIQAAIEACKARFSTAPRKPTTPPIVITRHLGTPECRDTEIKMRDEECVTACPAATASHLISRTR